MSLSTRSGALVASILLALLVVGAMAPSGDSSRATWTTSRPELDNPAGFARFLATDPMNGSVWRERFDPVLALAVSPVRDTQLAFDLQRTLGLTLLFFFLTRIAISLGASEAFSLPAACVFALLLAPAARILPGLWTISPWPAALALALIRLDARPDLLRVMVAAAGILALRFGSEPWFHLSLIPLALWALGPGTRYPRASAFLALLTVALWIATGGDSPPPGPTIGEVPVVFGFRLVAEVARPAETAGAALLGLAGALAFLGDSRSRRPLLVSGVLVWASFGLHVPAKLSGIPPFEVFEWIPNGDEFLAPALLLPAAVAVTTIALARAASGRLPALVGWMAAGLGAGALAFPLACSEPESRPPLEPGRCAVPTPSGSPILTWPPDTAGLVDCLERNPPVRAYANLDESIIPGLAPFLARRPDPFWSEDFWIWARNAGVSRLQLLGKPLRRLPPGVVLSSGRSDLFTLDATTGLRRFDRLAPVSRSGWTASSTGSNPALLPESAAFDGDTETRWGSGRPQRPGQYFELDLGLETPGVTRMVLYTGPWKSDWPRRLVVSTITEDGAMEVLADDSRPVSPRLVIDFPPTVTRRIRLAQEGVAVVFDWSIAEIEVWVEPSILLTPTPAALPLKSAASP